jgi:hypothetical protein
MNANTNLNVLSGILDAMLANLVETIDKRVEAKVFTLTERIERLETDLKAVEGQLFDLKNAAVFEGLEGNLRGTPTVFQPTDDVILRLDKLEERLSGEQPDTKFSLSILDCEEFRHAVQQAQGASVTIDLDSEEFRLSVIKIIDQQVMEDTFLDPLVEAVTDSDRFNDKVNTAAVDAASSEVEEALDNHTSDYDHDDIHEMSDHEMDSDAIREVVEEIINNSTVTFKI